MDGEGLDGPAMGWECNWEIEWKGGVYGMKGRWFCDETGDGLDGKDVNVLCDEWVWEDECIKAGSGFRFL